MNNEWINLVEESTKELLNKFQTNFLTLYKEENEQLEKDKSRVIADINEYKRMFATEHSSLDNLIKEKASLEEDIINKTKTLEEIDKRITERNTLLKESENKVKEVTTMVVGLKEREDRIKETEQILIQRDNFLKEREEAVKRYMARLGLQV